MKISDKRFRTVRRRGQNGAVKSMWAEAAIGAVERWLFNRVYPALTVCDDATRG